MDAAARVTAAAADLLAAQPELAAQGPAWRDAAVVRAAADAWAHGGPAAVTGLAAAYDALLLLEPRVVEGQVRLTAVGNAERRHRGAFSTPPAYAAALAGRAIPAAVGHVVDPACGAGALLRAALDRLLALGLPAHRARDALHGVDADPVAVLLCRFSLAAALTRAGLPTAPDDLADRILTGDALLGATPRRPAAGPGITWHEAFPLVLAAGGPEEPVTGWCGGFDAVVANPPWERLKVHARDWNGTPPPGLRGNRAGVARSLRDAGRHPLTGAGELNAYLPFVETCWRLLAPEGRAAILVPAGIASDRSAAGLLEELAQAGSLARLHLIDPDAPVFAGVSARIGVAVIDLAGGPAGRRPRGPAEVAVGLADPADPPGERAWPLDAALLRTLNPNTGTAPLFSSREDARIVTAVHHRVPVLRRRAPEAGDWRIRLVTPLHMTRDARHFRDRPAEGYLPLWEAKHCGLLDPRGGSVAGHRYWVPRAVVEARYGELCARGWLAGFRNVSTAAAPRTLLPTPLPVAGVGNSLPLVSADRLPLLLAALASLPVDYLLRQKHAGANVNFFKLEQVPVPPPAAYDVVAGWADGPIGSWVLTRFARAVVWSDGLEALADELRGAGVVVPERALTEAERATARAEIDAAHARLLGLTRPEVCHLLSTFTALRTRELTAHGRFVTAERMLFAYDALE
jgi:Eco57I restriction-modification methylase